MDNGDGVANHGAVPLEPAAKSQQGEEEPEEEIGPDDLLYRRLSPEAFDDDGTENGSANSLAFFLRPNETYVSADVARLTTADEVHSKKPEFGLCSIRVRDVQALGFTVRFAEDPNDPNHKAHAKIEGDFSKANRRLLAMATTVLRRPTAPRKQAP